MRSVIIGEELQSLVVGICRNRGRPARCQVGALSSQNPVRVGVAKSCRKIRFATERGTPFRDAELSSRINLIDQGAHARNPERLRVKRLNSESAIRYVGSFADIGWIPPVAVNA